MPEQRRPGGNPPGFESPDFETDTSRSVTPRETPAASSGNTFAGTPRLKPAVGTGSTAAVRPPPPPGTPERRPAGPSAFLDRRTSPAADSRGVDKRPAPPTAPVSTAPELPSVIVEPPRRVAPPPAAEPTPGGIERRTSAFGVAYSGPERRSTGAMRRVEADGASNAPRFSPPQPRNLEELGLSATMVEELVLKAIFFAGEMRGMDIANRLKLPTTVVDEILEGLRRQKYIDIRGGGGSGLGKSTMIYQLTTFATDVLRQILDRNRYNGPAPVSLQEWIQSVKKQSIRGNRITRQRMEDKFGDLIIRDYIFDGIGPAMNSGRAIFFYGPPGNGKTAICQGMVNCFDGDIFIPHAILIDDFIVRIYDSILHRPVEDEPGAPAYDRRWVRCRRPLVVVGGELTLDMLDLVYSPEVKYYEAPFQMKATNGMLLIDDFGRQKVSPKDLLNRWIVPLESDVDMLTLHTGKKVQVPFDVFSAFSTNLDPSDLVDDAFLRRVRYKLEVQRPDEDLFHQIFQVMCDKRGVDYDPEVVQYLINTHYKPNRRLFAACQPRDLLDQMIDMAHYRGEPPRLSRELVDSAVRSYFVRFDKEKGA
ncbi:ATPase [Melittangium boletus]|uniref:ATPase with chaperone activity, associated with Flp pilus assembly n=1 Tax=Melittangium boletus DSM 14713 TaxID=1294270 RepID=A0A250IS72_9BACT|nr:ATPase [Melittangium boletus]ATB34093.1 ATPase with chaperone activity, associated with Flp pilus assembly [Melittangium boletus DSM 14713]